MLTVHLPFWTYSGETLKHFYISFKVKHHYHVYFKPYHVLVNAIRLIKFLTGNMKNKSVCLFKFIRIINKISNIFGVRVLTFCTSSVSWLVATFNLITHSAIENV